MSAGRRSLVIHPGALGDVLLALPALAHLGQLLPDGVRVAATTAGPRALLDGSPYAEATRSFDDLGLHRLFVAEPDRAALATLAAFDVVVSWFGAHDPTYRAHLASLGPRVVVARAVPPRESPRHASRHLLETLAPLGPLPPTLPAVRLSVGEAERRGATDWLAERGLARGVAVVLHPGAGSPAKVWPHYAPLARRLEAAGQPVVVVTGPAESATAPRIAAEARLPEGRLAVDWPLRRLAALLEAARAFVGNDSGPSHLAAAVGCPTLALFGPTDAAVWAPLGAAVRVLAAAAGWAPLTPERVADALLEWVETGPARLLAG